MKEIGERRLFKEGSLQSIGSEVPKAFPKLIAIGPDKVPGVYAGIYRGTGSVEVMIEMENLQDMREIKRSKEQGLVNSFEFYVAYASEVIYPRPIPYFVERLISGFSHT